MKPMQPDAIPPNEQAPVCRMIDIDNEAELNELVEFSGRVLKYKTNIELLRKIESKGGYTFAVFSGGKIIAIATVYTARREDHERNPLTRNLPEESVFGIAAGVDPDFRGKGLQTALFEKRKNFAREIGKETILGTIRIENGASLRNNLTAGGRILYFAYLGPKPPPEKNPLRVVSEIDLKQENKEIDLIEEAQAVSPDEAPDALKRGDKKIVLRVMGKKDEDEGGVDLPANNATEQILSLDYVGTGIQLFHTDDQGNTISGILFKHLSTFPPEIAARLRKRKEKIKSLLE